MSELTEFLKSETLVQRFDNVAPEWMKFDSEYSFAVQQLMSNDYLAKVAMNDKASLLAAMSNVAACGLSLNPAEKTAYLIPRKGKICFDPSYMGLIRLATNTGSIEWVQAYCVHEADNFMLRGADEQPLFETDPFQPDRGPFRGAFCVAKTKKGDYLTTAMSADEIHKVRDASESVKKHGPDNPKAGPWVTHFDEMAKKTVIRRAFKTWPLSDQNDNDRRLAQAVHVSNQNEDVVLATSTPDLGQYSDEAKKYFDQLIEQGDAEGMVVFQFSKDEKEWTNLYHSFPKGQKGKYQKIVDDLYNKGMSMVADYANLINEAAANGNEDDIADYIADMGELRPLVEKRVTNEAAMAMRAA